jgi:acid phosphatase type 7
MTPPSESAGAGVGKQGPGQHKRRLAIDRRSAVVVGLALAVAVALYGLLASGAFTSLRRSAAPALVRATIPAAAAASVFAAAPDIARGASSTLRVDGSPVARTYLRFDLSRLTGRVTSAKLSFDPLSANPVGLAVDLVPGSWTENQLTYFTAPRPGARIGLSGPLSPGVRSSIDVTRFVQGAGELDLALVALGSQQIAVAGRERGGLGPRLAVVLQGGRVAAHAVRPSHAQAPAGVAGQASPAAGAGPGSLASAAKAATAGSMAAGAGHDPLLAAAGDIACGPATRTYQGGNGTENDCHERVTSQMLLRIHPTAVLPLGDEQYQCGALSDFRASYGPTWGRLMAISHPVPGNHEYGGGCHRSSATGYFRFFGAVAGRNDRGWYSYNVGSWHMIALNSECSSGREGVPVGGCGAGSPQETWLRRDLATHPQRCTLAYWHEPRFSSGEHGDNQQMAALWNDLARAHVDVVLSGHNHDYERFAPIGVVPGVQVPTGPTDQPNFEQPILNANGIHEFVVGTGGKNHYAFTRPPLRGERVRNDNTYGLLLLRLRPHGYSWRFVPEPGKTFTDSGSATCS